MRSAAFRFSLRLFLSSVLWGVHDSTWAEMPIPNRGGAPDLASYQFLTFPNAARSPTIVENRLRFLVPIRHDALANWSANVTAGYFRTAAPLTLFPAGTPVPEDLWILSAGVNYNRKLEGDRFLAFNLGLGSDSDALFHSLHETALSLTALYRTPTDDKNEWLFGISFSTNRIFLNYLPIPLVAYSFKNQTGSFQGTVGFPFASLRWKPDPVWDFVVGIYGPTNLTAEAGRKFSEVTRLCAGFYWNQPMWMVAGRTDPSTRLFYDAKRAGLGLLFPVVRPFVLDLAAGYAFDRSFFVGTSVLRQTDVAPLDAGWYLGATLKLPIAEVLPNPPRS